MGVTFYLIPILSGKNIYSIKLVKHTFWWVSIGVYSFYIIQMIFGIWEGMLLHSGTADISTVHRYYGPVMAVSGTTMAIGFSTFFANVVLTVTREPKDG
jgi:cytochrome c oxidase cbb3-type subunit 1